MGAFTVQLKVEPGKTWNDADSIDAASLNETANPKVSLEAGAGIRPEHLDMEAFLAEVGDALRGVNWITRPNFWPQDWLGDEVTAAPGEGIFTENAYDWYVTHADGSAEVAYRRTSASPNNDSCFAATLVGATGNTEVRFLNWLSSAVTGQLRAEQLTFSMYVRNNTGAQAWVSPVLYVAGVADSRESTDEAFTAPAISIESGDWKRITHTFEAGDYPNFKNGAFIGLETTNLDTDLKSLVFAQAQLEVSAVASNFKRPPVPPVPRDDSLPPCYIGEDLETPASFRLVMDNGVERRFCAPHPGFTKPVITWDYARKHPIWIEDGETKFVYYFNGGDQLISVPSGKNIMDVKLWGAGGSNDYGTPGGVGGYSYASFDVTDTMQFMLVVGQSSYRKGTNPYGFAGRAHGHQFNGGGLTGIFVGNTPVQATDSGRAVIIAGGGGAGRESYGGEKRAGGPGGNPATSGGMPSMQGQEALGTAAYSGDGGGGGGHAGGADWNRAGYGGTSFIISSPLANLGAGNVVFRAGDSNGKDYAEHGVNIVPGNGDSDYEAPAGEAATPSGNPARPVDEGGHGLIVISWRFE